jgi:protein TonB
MTVYQHGMEPIRWTAPLPYDDDGLSLWLAFLLALIVEFLLLLSVSHVNWGRQPDRPEPAPMEVRMVDPPEEHKPRPKDKPKPLRETPPPPEELSPVVKSTLPRPDPEPAPEPPPRQRQEVQPLEAQISAEKPAPETTLEPAKTVPDLAPALSIPDTQIAQKSAGPVKKVKPIYPKNALKMGIGGRVLVRLKVDATGTVTQAQILEAEPKRIFDKVVLDAVRQYQFLPDGKIFEADQEIIFSMGEDE